MKSIRIKALITILLLAITLCSKLRRTETETEVEATFKSLVKATVTASGGDWEKGYNCPSIFLAQGAGKQVDQGPAHIEGIKFIENKGDNLLGLVLNFEKPIAANSLMAQISKKLAGNKIYIPWRFFSNNYIFEDPYFNNKHIEGNLKTDNGVAYHLKINFPYAYTTTYLMPDKGNIIRERINSKASTTASIIKDNREYITRKYPAYLNAKNDEANIAKGQQLIGAQIQKNQANIDVIKKNNDLTLREIGPMVAQYNKEYIASMAAKGQIAKIDNEITETNAAIKALSDSITTLNKSKDDPKMQTSLAKKKEAENAAKADLEYKLLLIFAPERAKEINASRAAFMAGRSSEYKSNILSFVPK